MFTLAIPDVFDSVESPVIARVIKDLIRNNMLPKPSRTQYQEVIKKEPVPGAKRANRRKQGAYLFNEDVLLVEMEFIYDTENTGHWLRNDLKNTKPIFWDDKLNISIRPKYDKVTVILTLTYQTTSIARLRQWERTMQTDVTLGKDRLMHSLNYTYAMDRLAYDWLSDLHRLRENRYGYGHDFSQYLKDHMGNETVVFQAGKTRQLNIRERQVHVAGYLAPPFIPQITDLGDARYAGTIGYEFSYTRPTATMHDAPLVIHQQQVPDKYIIMPEADPKHVIFQSGLMRGINSRTNMNMAKSTTTHVRVPEYDRTLLGRVYPDYVPLVTCLIGLEDYHKGSVLFNLRRIGDVDLDESVLEYIEKILHERLHKPYLSPFLISLHGNGRLLDLNYLRCHKNLDIVLEQDVDPRVVYRVTFNLLSSLSAIPDKFLRELDGISGLVGVVVDAVNGIHTTEPNLFDGPNPYIIQEDIVQPGGLSTVGEVVDSTGVPYTSPIPPEGGDTTVSRYPRHGGVLSLRKTVQRLSVEVGKK